jgi:hypothetical protein
MKLLADLIKNRSEEMGEKLLVPEIVTEEDKRWHRCKIKVNELTTDYKEAINLALTNKPLSVNKRRIDGGSVIEVTMLIEGYTCGLYVCESPMSVLSEPRYIAWDHINNKCFIRDLDKGLDAY